MNFANVDLGDRTSALGFGPSDHLGQPVLVTPCERRATGTIRPLDDHLFACHAAFDWRSAKVTVTTRGGGSLSYKVIRQIARFSRASLPHAVLPADRIVRSWTGPSSKSSLSTVTAATM